MKKKFFSAIIITAAIVIAACASPAEAFAEGQAVPDSLTCTVGGVTTSAAFSENILLDPETPLDGSGTVTFASTKPDFGPTQASLNLNNGSGSVSVNFTAEGYEDYSVTIQFTVAQGTMGASAADVNVQYDGKPHPIDVKVTGTSKYKVYYSTDGQLDSANYTSASQKAPEYTVPGTNTTVYYYVHYTGSGNFQDKSAAQKSRSPKRRLP